MFTKIIFYLLLASSIIVITPKVPSAPKTQIPAKKNVEFGDLVTWKQYPTQNNNSNKKWGKKLTDLEQHLDPKHGNYYHIDTENITSAHETTHGINSDLRNKFCNSKQSAFYCFDGKYIVLDDPNVTIAQIVPNVPSSLRFFRYNAYLVNNTNSYWNNKSTYLIDEWVSYINGTLTGIDQTQASKYVGRKNSDDTYTSMEFAYYILAMYVTIKQHDPNYFNNNNEFKEFVAFNIRRSAEAYENSKNVFSWQSNIIQTFATANDVQPLRDIALELYGKDFCKKYLYF